MYKSSVFLNINYCVSLKKFCVLLVLKLKQLKLLPVVFVFGGLAHAATISPPILNPSNGHTYYLLSANSWQDCERQAVVLGGHLVTINDKIENDWVFNTFSNYEGVPRYLWIGLNDSTIEGNFQWISGEPVTFTSWATGEPNNGSSVPVPQENYVHFWGPASDVPVENHYKWNDHPGIANFDGVAEIIPLDTTKKIDSTLIASWSFDNIGKDFVIFDSSAYKHDIIVINGNSGISLPFGPYRRYCKFNNDSAELLIRNSRAAFNSPSFTVLSFVYFYNFTGYQTLFQSNAFDSCTHCGFQIQITPTGNVRLCLGKSFGWQNFETVSRIPRYTTKHIAVSYDSTEVKIYIDGILDVTYYHTGGLNIGNGIAIIGRSSINGVYSNYFRGAFDEVKIYNRVISDSSIYAAAFPSGNDNDGDGYKSEQDCNDYDPNINPGELELNDGIDNNCNGQIDEGYAPVIITHPQSQTVNSFATVTFVIAARSFHALRYQWKKNGIDISSTDSPFYCIPSVSAADAGVYSVVVSNAFGNTESNPAVLTVQAENIVIDIDGNVYNTIALGNQMWTIENFRASHYNDGTAIQNVTPQTDWRNLNTGAYCFYQNTTSVSEQQKWGALYNWHAVNTGKLPPTGWRIPNDYDWFVLRNYLITNGYNFDGTTSGAKFAKSLAARTDWLSTNETGAIGNNRTSNNLSGFSALPGGYRHSNGGFESKNYVAYFWCSNSLSTAYSYGAHLYYNSSELRIYNDNAIRSGFSVRLVKDIN